MFGIRYKKGSPTTYVMHFINGSVSQQGAGLAFWYFAPNSTIVDIPLNSVDIPFIFQDVTSDFQPVAVQGQLTYRVWEATKLANLLDFSVGPSGAYLNNKDPRDLLAQRLISIAQVSSQEIMQQMPLKAVLSGCESIGRTLLTKLRTDETIVMLGVEVLALALLAIKATPETAKALEAETREALLRQADQATYARRNAAVEEERRIKESELNTEIAVENKQREIREIKIQADIALEEQRSLLIDKSVENQRKDADSKAYALTVALAPLKNIDWKILMAIAAKDGDPRFAISLAFEELAANANKIGQLNLTPDLLQSLLVER